MSIGSTLAEARREAGLTITQVGQRTRIRESIIRGIEADDYSACGGDFYSRGHIRSIAHAIGIDPAPLIKDYDAEHGDFGSITAAEVFEPTTPIKLGERRRRSPSLSMIVLVVLLAIIGFSVYKLTSHGGKAAALVPVHHPTPSVTAVRSAPKPSVVVNPYAGKVVIQVAATGQCWAELTKANGGAVIFEGDIQPGSSATWTERQPVILQLGNPSGIQLTVNGKQLTTNVLHPLAFTLKPARP
ncbi:MAG TPA: RodZ domain-containing protein [Streptosporangiaceae bacterium]|nr:RodZ domain-containing protein [Streptosporangiaceae bacterium]